MHRLGAVAQRLINLVAYHGRQSMLVANGQVTYCYPCAMNPERETTTAVPVVGIVGIGASAGGLAAFEAFFSGMPYFAARAAFFSRRAVV